MAQSEFGAARLGDERLLSRLLKLAAACMANPSGSLPQACGHGSQTKAAYRFLSNRSVLPPLLLQAHRDQTRARMAAHPLVLVVQDTTSLTYGERAGLGVVGSLEGPQGLWLHTSMAFTPQGRSLGIAHLEYWTRSPAEFGKAARRHTRDQSEKESQRWINSFEDCVQLSAALGAQTRVVNVADREGDLFALFATAALHPEVGVLVRARHDRKSPEGQTFSQALESEPSAGSIEVRVPRRPGVPARTARLEVSFRQAQVAPPARAEREEPLRLWILCAREKDGGATRIDWRLLTNLPVENLQRAVEMIGWYRVRWQIEEYHRTLKSGCQAQRRQMEEATRLENILMIDLVVAWRVLELSRAARADKLESLEAHFSAPEIELLKRLRKPREAAPAGPMTLRDAVRQIAEMGGFLGRKGDGEPGAMTLWRGLEKFHAILEGWLLAQTCG